MLVTEVTRWHRDVEQFVAADRLAELDQGIVADAPGAPSAGAEARVRVGRRGPPGRLGVGRGGVPSAPPPREVSRCLPRGSAHRAALAAAGQCKPLSHRWRPPESADS